MYTAISDNFGKEVLALLDSGSINSKLIEPTVKISANQTYTTRFTFESQFSPGFFYFWVNGSYKNAEGSDTYKINDVYFYNVVGKTSGIVIGNTRTNIITILKKQWKLKA